MSRAATLRAQQTWAGPPTSPVCGFWLPELPWVHFCAYGTADGTVVVLQLTVRSGQASAQRLSFPSIPSNKLGILRLPASQPRSLAQTDVCRPEGVEHCLPQYKWKLRQRSFLLPLQAARNGEEGQGEAAPTAQLLLELRTAGGQRAAADVAQVAWAEAGGAFLLAAAAGGTLAVVSLQRCAPAASGQCLHAAALSCTRLLSRHPREQPSTALACGCPAIQPATAHACTFSACSPRWHCHVRP